MSARQSQDRDRVVPTFRVCPPAVPVVALAAALITARGPRVSGRSTLDKEVSAAARTECF